MSDERNKTPGSSQEEQPGGPYTPASPLKRIWAWVGVVYMVIIVFLMTYMYGTGTYLQGIAALMLIPALGGGAASAVCLWLTAPQEGRTPVRRAMMILITALCLALIVVNLINGIPALLANFGG